MKSLATTIPPGIFVAACISSRRTPLHADALMSESRTPADRYTLEGEIGAGGMVTVHRARDLRDT